MSIYAMLIIGLVIVIHLYIVYLEMFAWTTKGPKVFRGFPKDLFPKTKAMAANQGLYNGFLAAGLILSLIIKDVEWQQHVAMFFLGCIAVAGIYGALTVSKRILYVQTAPALIGITLLFVG